MNQINQTLKTVTNKNINSFYDHHIKLSLDVKQDPIETGDGTDQLLQKVNQFLQEPHSNLLEMSVNLYSLLNDALTENGIMLNDEIVKQNKFSVKLNNMKLKNGQDKLEQHRIEQAKKAANAKKRKIIKIFICIASSLLFLGTAKAVKSKAIKKVLKIAGVVALARGLMATIDVHCSSKVAKAFQIASEIALGIGSISSKTVGGGILGSLALIDAGCKISSLAKDKKETSYVGVLKKFGCSEKLAASIGGVLQIACDLTINIGSGVYTGKSAMKFLQNKPELLKKLKVLEVFLEGNTVADVLSGTGTRSTDIYYKTEDDYNDLDTQEKDARFSHANTTIDMSLETIKSWLKNLLTEEDNNGQAFKNMDDNIFGWSDDLV